MFGSNHPGCPVLGFPSHMWSVKVLGALGRGSGRDLCLSEYWGIVGGARSSTGPEMSIDHVRLHPIYSVSTPQLFGVI